jgi:superfamily II DNA/RNA helicase
VKYVNIPSVYVLVNFLILQLLRRDEELYGILMRPRRPQAVVLCPTRELSEQVSVCFLQDVKITSLCGLMIFN